MNGSHSTLYTDSNNPCCSSPNPVHSILTKPTWPKTAMANTVSSGSCNASLYKLALIFIIALVLIFSHPIGIELQGSLPLAKPFVWQLLLENPEDTSWPRWTDPLTLKINAAEYLYHTQYTFILALTAIQTNTLFRSGRISRAPPKHLIHNQFVVTTSVSR